MKKLLIINTLPENDPVVPNALEALRGGVGEVGSAAIRAAMPYSKKKAEDQVEKLDPLLSLSKKRFFIILISQQRRRFFALPPAVGLRMTWFSVLQSVVTLHKTKSHVILNEGKNLRS